MTQAQKTATRTAGHCLEREYYVSAEILELDIQRIFFKHWIYAGHLSQIPNAGDYFLYQIGGESLIVVRQADGGVRGHFNVCRHRGARFMQEPCGTAKALRCPYHSWVYGLDGALLNAPGMLDEVCSDKLGLMPVWVEVWHGLIYVNLSQDQPHTSVATLLEKAEESVAPFKFEEAKIAQTIVYDVEANWKLFMENYRECYHCLANHPEFCATVPVGRGQSLPQASVGSRIINAPSLTYSNYPMRPGAKTQSLDGEQLSIPLGDWQLNGETLAVAPNYYLNFYPAHGLVFNIDYAMAFSIHPIDPGHTKLDVDWYVNGQAEEGKDYDVKDLVAFWDITHRQDLALCKMNQQGVNSRRYVPGPYSPHEEEDVDHLMNFYVNAFSNATVPPRPR